MNKEPQFEYSQQEGVLEAGDHRHHFSVFEKGEKVGGVEIDYFSKPIPLYQLTELYVDADFQNKGYASELLHQTELWLKTKKKPGILVDSIMYDEKPEKGFYEKRGWTSVPGSDGLYVFNWPLGVSLEVLKGYSSRYTDYMERGENLK